MFSGLIESTGSLIAREPHPQGQRLRFQLQKPNDLLLGESIAVNGACLTVVQTDGLSFVADLSPETISRTTLGELLVGDKVNLERALRLQDRLGGHFVLGHVDGLAEVSQIDRRGEYHRIVIELPRGLEKYAISKGSMAIDGVSLTINHIQNQNVEFMIIPHTWVNTTIGDLRLKQKVNIEGDYLVKIVLKQKTLEREISL